MTQYHLQKNEREKDTNELLAIIKGENTPRLHVQE